MIGRSLGRLIGGSTRVETRTTKRDAEGRVISEETWVKESGTLGKVVKIGLLAGLALIALSAITDKK